MPAKYPMPQPSNQTSLFCSDKQFYYLGLNGISRWNPCSPAFPFPTLNVVISRESILMMKPWPILSGCLIVWKHKGNTFPAPWALIWDFPVGVLQGRMIIHLAAALILREGSLTNLLAIASPTCSITSSHCSSYVFFVWEGTVFRQDCAKTATGSKIK